MQPHSGMASDATTMMTSTNETHQNVSFGDQHASYNYVMDTEVDETRTQQDSQDATLQNFFSRPIKVYEVEWGTATTMFEQFNPWKLYFENPRVSNRLSNFNLLRAKLHLKFLINGNGFQYGRAIATYLPMHTFDTLSKNVALVPETLVQASQQPHIFLNPTMSTGGEMVLPFFNFYNYVSIPESEWEILGQITMRSINALKHANGAVDKVTVSVFAWAEDVSMSVLTSVEPNTMIPQSGAEVDEANAKGVISGPATAVSTAAKSLSIVPWLRPYAMATSTVASSLSSIAKVFGYSRPTLTKAPEPYRPTIISSLANTNTPDTVAKLTLDDKQELTVDPRISGLGAGDPLVIKDIAKRESYLTTFDWNIGTAPETLLWNCRVSPVVWAESGATAYHFPACCFAALPFRYWTGTMNFRFQIVCSAFHKGRLKIVYDPNWLAENEYNTNYIKIVDISDENDFTVSVANGQDRTWLSHARPASDSLTTIYGTSAFASRGEGNGVFGVYIVNELTTPNSTANNDIQVNVYVSMGDDFEVAVPDNSITDFVLSPQSGKVADSDLTTEPDKPQHDYSEYVGPTTDPLTNNYKVFQGEVVKSFRQLLKRYNLHSAISPRNASPRDIYQRCAMFPYCRGNVPNAVHSTVALAPYNYCNTVMLHWVTWAFSGWRGSIRYKLLPVHEMDEGAVSTIYVDRQPRSFVSAQWADGESVWNAYTTVSEAAHAVVSSNMYDTEWKNTPPDGLFGSHFISSNVNSACEFEVPFYTWERFNPGKNSDWTGATYTTNRPVEEFNVRWGVDGGTNTRLDFHVAAGEDFQTYFFTGLPPLYFENDPPSPAV